MEPTHSDTEKTFQEFTWENVYTSSQKQQLINKVSTLLEKIITSEEIKGLLKPFPLGNLQLEKECTDPTKGYYVLFIGKDGLTEGADNHHLTSQGIQNFYFHKEVSQDRYAKIIEQYKLDYKKLESFLNMIQIKIV